jgi:dTDP-D-glucose 4,6-dehydratase
MNLYLEASILATSRVGAHLVKNHFQLFQTPTEITKKAMRSKDPKQVYIDWGVERLGHDSRFHA